ncbi:MAG: DUF4251 domain-containing protein [Tannerella sp.]|jgi:hypothetical protein|nr:DUF4251 domain-containing protein [Tannerella sp.]
MKTVKCLFTGILLMGVMGWISCSSTNAASKSEIAQSVKSQVEARDFKIEVNRMIPMSGRSRDLTPPYALTIKGDSIHSWLPYMGQGYNLPYGGGQGLTFDATITDYSQSYDSKGTANIELRTRSNDDTYIYRIQIFDNGTSSIYVTPNHRQSISYLGKLEIKL